MHEYYVERTWLRSRQLSWESAVQAFCIIYVYIYIYYNIYILIYIYIYNMICVYIYIFQAGLQSTPVAEPAMGHFSGEAPRPWRGST